MLPGTVEELAEAGLLSSYLCGHMESARQLLDLAQQGQLSLHTLPQGVMAQLIELQGKGVNKLRSSVGVGCFFDPRVGEGSTVTPSDQQYVRVAGEKLEYTMPKLDVALISASYADKLETSILRTCPRSLSTEKLPLPLTLMEAKYW